MLKYFSVLIIFGTVILLNSCKKRVDDFTTASISDYYPLEVGKYITYNLDSTVFINFGERDTVISYQVQDKVDAQITDNNGKPAYRIIRYIRKDETQDWLPNNTFMAVPTDNSFEFVENNLRFIKLKLPVTEGFSWMGNSYIDTYSVNSDVKYLDGWQYTYDSVNMPLTLGSLTVDSTITVNERDEFLGQDPNIEGTQYAEKNYSLEKYAKGIGPVYREFIHWEYQGASPGRDPYYLGYGVKLSMIDHN